MFTYNRAILQHSPKPPNFSTAGLTVGPGCMHVPLSRRNSVPPLRIVPELDSRVSASEGASRRGGITCAVDWIDGGEVLHGYGLSAACAKLRDARPIVAKPVRVCPCACMQNTESDLFAAGCAGADCKLGLHWNGCKLQKGSRPVWISMYSQH